MLRTGRISVESSVLEALAKKSKLAAHEKGGLSVGEANGRLGGRRKQPKNVNDKRRKRIRISAGACLAYIKASTLRGGKEDNGKTKSLVS